MILVCDASKKSGVPVEEIISAGANGDIKIYGMLAFPIEVFHFPVREKVYPDQRNTLPIAKFLVCQSCPGNFLWVIIHTDEKAPDTI